MSRRKSLNRRRSLRRSSTHQSILFNEDSEILDENNERWYENSVVKNSVRFSNSVRASTFLNANSEAEGSPVQDKWYEQLPQDEDSLNIQLQLAKKQVAQSSSSPETPTSYDNAKTSSDTESEQNAGKKRFHFRKRVRKSTGINNYSDAFNESPTPSRSSLRNKRSHDSEAEQNNVSKRPKSSRSKRVLEPTDLNETNSSIEKTDKLIKSKPAFFKKKSIQPLENEFDDAWDESTLNEHDPSGKVDETSHRSNQNLPIKKRLRRNTNGILNSPIQPQNNTPEKNGADGNINADDLPIANKSMTEVINKPLLSKFKQPSERVSDSSKEESTTERNNAHDKEKTSEGLELLQNRNKSLNTSNISLRSQKASETSRHLRSSTNLETLNASNISSDPQTKSDKSRKLQSSANHEALLNISNISPRAQKENDKSTSLRSLTNRETLVTSNILSQPTSSQEIPADSIHSQDNHFVPIHKSANSKPSTMRNNSHKNSVSSDFNIELDELIDAGKEHGLNTKVNEQGTNEKLESLKSPTNSSDSGRSEEIPRGPIRSWNKYSLRSDSSENETEERPKKGSSRRSSVSSRTENVIDIKTIDNVQKYVNNDYNSAENKTRNHSPDKILTSSIHHADHVSDISYSDDSVGNVSPVENKNILHSKDASEFAEPSNRNTSPMPTNVEISNIDLSTLDSSKINKSETTARRSLKNASRISKNQAVNSSDNTVESDNEMSLMKQMPVQSHLFRKRMQSKESSTNFDDAFDSESNEDEGKSNISNENDTSSSKNVSDTESKKRNTLPPSSECETSSSNKSTKNVSKSSASKNHGSKLRFHAEEFGSEDENQKNISSDNVNSVSYTESSGEENPSLNDKQTSKNMSKIEKSNQLSNISLELSDIFKQPTDSNKSAGQTLTSSKSLTSHNAEVQNNLKSPQAPKRSPTTRKSFKQTSSNFSSKDLSSSLQNLIADLESDDNERSGSKIQDQSNKNSEITSETKSSKVDRTPDENNKSSLNVTKSPRKNTSTIFSDDKIQDDSLSPEIPKGTPRNRKSGRKTLPLSSSEEQNSSSSILTDDLQNDNRERVIKQKRTRSHLSQIQERTNKRFTSEIASKSEGTEVENTPLNKLNNTSSHSTISASKSKSNAFQNGAISPSTQESISQNILIGESVTTESSTKQTHQESHPSGVINQSNKTLKFGIAIERSSTPDERQESNVQISLKRKSTTSFNSEVHNHSNASKNQEKRANDQKLIRNTSKVSYSKDRNVETEKEDESEKSGSKVSSVSFTDDQSANSSISNTKNTTISENATNINEQNKKSPPGKKPDNDHLSESVLNSPRTSEALIKSRENQESVRNSSYYNNDLEGSLLIHGIAQSTLAPTGKPIDRYSKLPINDNEMNDYISSVEMTSHQVSLKSNQQEHRRQLKNANTNSPLKQSSIQGVAIQLRFSSSSSEQNGKPLLTRSRKDIPAENPQKAKVLKPANPPSATSKNHQTNILDFFTKGKVVAEDVWAKAKQKTDKMQEEAHVQIEEEFKMAKETKKPIQFRNPLPDFKKRTTKPINKAYVVDGVPYKPPKLPFPKPWVTNKLYKYVWKRLEPKYGLSTRIQSEKFIKKLSDIVAIVERRRKYDNYKAELTALMMEMARLGLIVTRDNFYAFCQEFIPWSFRKKVIPMIFPGNVRNIPFNPKLLHVPILQN